MDNVQGVFIVLYGGCLVASVLGVIESCFYCCKRSRETKVLDHCRIFNGMHCVNPLNVLNIVDQIKNIIFMRFIGLNMNFVQYTGSVQKGILRRDEVHSEVRE